MRYPIVSVKYLKLCKLWEGSMLHNTFKFGGGLPLEDVQMKYFTLTACDDRTPAENELLEALRKTIADPLGLKE